MATMFIRHKVEDYARWKRGYDEADWLRKQHGITYASLHREETIGLSKSYNINLSEKECARD